MSIASINLLAKLLGNCFRKIFMLHTYCTVSAEIFVQHYRTFSTNLQASAQNPALEFGNESEVTFVNLLSFLFA